MWRDWANFRIAGAVSILVLLGLFKLNLLSPLRNIIVGLIVTAALLVLTGIINGSR